ncbi:hypothetical protein Ancab_010992 [Ancistrocladus abbreviatus]
MTGRVEGCWVSFGFWFAAGGLVDAGAVIAWVWVDVELQLPCTVSSVRIVVAGGSSFAVELQLLCVASWVGIVVAAGWSLVLDAGCGDSRFVCLRSSSNHRLMVDFRHGLGLVWTDFSTGALAVWDAD